MYLYLLVAGTNFTELIAIPRIIKHPFQEKHQHLIMKPNVILFSSLASLLTTMRPRGIIPYNSFPKATTRLRLLWCLLQCPENWEAYYFNLNIKKNIKKYIHCSLLWTSFCTTVTNAFSIRRVFMMQCNSNNTKKGVMTCPVHFPGGRGRESDKAYFCQEECPLFSTGF